MSESTPNDSLVPLGSVLTGIDAGHSPDLEDIPANPGEWGVLKVSAIGEGRFHPEENKVVRDRRLFDPTICVRQGDLLITRANTAQLVGRSCIAESVPSGLMLCDKTLRLRVDERTVPARYVQLALGLDAVRRQIEVGATGTSGSMKNISQQSIRKLMIPIHGQGYVKRILEIINSADRSIASAEAVIDKLKASKSGLARHLLSGVSHPVLPLNVFLAEPPRNGFSPKEVGAWTGVVTLGLGCVTADGFVPRQLKNVPEGDPRYTRAWLSDGDLLITRSNTYELVGLVGRFRDVGAPCVYPDLMMRLVPNGRVRIDFLEIALRNMGVREQIKRMSQGTSGSMVKITGSGVANLPISIPDLSEQDRILSVYATAMTQISEQEREVEKLRLLKRGLVDNLLTGQLRY